VSIGSGTRLGPYEILSPLGAGGMGEVYRARDDRLGRDVALKVIASDGLPEPERVRRFEQEARAVAALGHPNILAVHDVGTHEGHPYVVFELLEGESLRDRLERGPLPMRKAIELGGHIGQGLAAAHARGVVHRDLKPANLFLTRDGRVKILDFGLAKLVEPTMLEASPEATPTVTGAFLGTPGYAAPEQVRALPADHRVDLFALGAVLYEMATGQKAFRGATAADTLSAVLNRDPPSMDGASGGGGEPVPAALERVVRRCLEKDPEERFQSARDVAFALDALAGTSGATAGQNPVGARSSVWRGLAVTGLVSLAGIMGYLWGPSRRDSPGKRAVRFVVSPPAMAPNVESLCVSPDGRSLAFQAWGDKGSSIWVRALDETEARPIPGTERTWGLAWSPDSRRLAFVSGKALKTIDLAGGNPVRVAEADSPILGDWSPEGVILFTDVGKGSALYRVPASGGEPTRVTTPTRGDTHLWPSFLPGGQRFLYQRPPREGATIHVGALGSQESRPLLTANSQAVYVASGHVLFVRGRALLAQPIDERTLRLNDVPFAVAENVWVDPIWGSGDFSASQNGVLAYRQQPVADRQLVWLDRSGRTVGTVGAAGRWQDPDLSPDGGRLVVTSADSPEASQLWIFDLVRGFSSRPAPEVVNARSALWSRDGRHLYYASPEPDGTGIYRRLVDGAGTGEKLTSDPRINALYEVSPDGKSLVLDMWGENGVSDLSVLPLDGKSQPRPLAETPFIEAWGRFSPDGKLLAFMYGEGPADSEVFVQPFPPTGVRWQVSAGGGGYPAWRSDGRELFYTGNRILMSVDVRPGTDRPSFGKPRALFETPPLRGPARSVYVVTRDGQRFLFVKELESRWKQPIVVVSDWLAARGR
jgi:Tol biopolymer transport system component